MAAKIQAQVYAYICWKLWPWWVLAHEGRDLGFDMKQACSA